MTLCLSPLYVACNQILVAVAFGLFFKEYLKNLKYCFRILLSLQSDDVTAQSPFS